MKTYQVIDAELQNHEFENGKNNNEGKRKLIIGLLKELLSNSKCRQELIINMNISDLKNDFTKEFEPNND